MKNRAEKLRQLLRDLANAQRQLQFTMNEIRKTIRGAELTINDPRYNGQPYGRSAGSKIGKQWVAEQYEWCIERDLRDKDAEYGDVLLSPPMRDCNDSILLSHLLIDGQPLFDRVKP